MTLGWGIFLLVRALTALLPPSGLRALFWPAARLRAAFGGGFPHRDWRAATAFHLSRFICFFPHRLTAPEWRERCRLRGFAPVRAALAAGRPVVLATLHFGPLPLMRYWLRAGGIPAATMVSESAGSRSALRLRKDALSDQATKMSGVPHVIEQGEVRKALRFLEQAAALMVAMDFHAGKLVEVREDGRVVRLSCGAIRLAARSGALLVPCLIRETGGWQFEIRCGQPVSDDVVLSKSVGAAAAHLWREFSAEVRAHPEDCGVELRACQSAISSVPPAAKPELITS
ncbi:MAG: hypothetical protein HZA89_16510 [Verrucomicrobia bacterium]|nr:hypothetical protein [Verrucomicrobiota bacterium]